MCSDIEVVIRSFCPCVLLTASVPKAMPWATSFWAFSPFLNHLQCSILITKVTTLSFHVAISMLLPPNIYAFTAQYLCFYLLISMLLQ